MSFDLRKPPVYERLTLDHPKAGAGERGFIVLRQGYKAVLLLYPPTLRAFNICVEDYRRARRAMPAVFSASAPGQPRGVAGCSTGAEAQQKAQRIDPALASRLARRLRQKRAQFRRLGVPFSAAAVRAALNALEARP